MSKLKLFTLLAGLLFILTACQRPDLHNSRNSLDWPGTYAGTIPAADCPGIEISITLRPDGSFTRSYFYLERSVTPTVETGRFRWSADGRILKTKSSSYKENYFVAEGKLLVLGAGDQPVTGDLAEHYVLHKK